MEIDNGSIIDDVSLKLTGLIAMFDLIGTSETPKLRDDTLSEFAFFTMQILEDMFKKVNSIDLGNNRYA